jgi:hypothetical protein
MSVHLLLQIFTALITHCMCLIWTTQTPHHSISHQNRTSIKRINLARVDIIHDNWGSKDSYHGFWTITSCILYRGLFNKATESSDHTALLNGGMIWWMMIWIGYGRKWSWCMSRYYPSCCLEGVRKVLRNVSQDSQWLSEDSNQLLLEHVLEVLLLEMEHSWLRSYAKSWNIAGSNYMSMDFF